MDGSALLFGTSVDIGLRWQYYIYQVHWVAWTYLILKFKICKRLA